MREKAGIQPGERERGVGRASERNRIEPSGAARVWVKQSERLELERPSQRHRERDGEPRPLSYSTQDVSIYLSMLWCKVVRLKLVRYYS